MHHAQTFTEQSCQIGPLSCKFCMYLQLDRNAVGKTWPTTDIPYEISPKVGKKLVLFSNLTNIKKHPYRFLFHCHNFQKAEQVTS